MINILPVISEINKPEKQSSMLSQFKEKLENYKIDFNLILSPEDKSPFLFLVLTGGTENKIMEITKIIEGPIILLCHPQDNSFAACLEIIASLNQKNRLGKIIMLNDKEPEELKKIIHLTEVNKKMQKARIGLIGGPSDWLVASNIPDINNLIKNWGPLIINITIDELIEEIENISEKDAREYAEELYNNSFKIIEPELDDIIKATKVYGGAKKISKKYNLQAISIKCFDLIKKLNTTGCYALSKLTDEKIISGCEGDLPGTLTMLWMYYISGELPFMANPQEININENTLSIAHCTIPRKILKNYILRSHFESSIGVSFQGEINYSNITLSRIGGKDLTKLFVLNGKIIEHQTLETRCRTQVKIKFSENISYFLEHPLGNHHILIPGQWEAELKDYHKLYI